MTGMHSWKTQLNILWLGQAILMAVMAMSLPYWPLYISTLGHYSPQEIRYWSAAIYIAPFISSTFSSPLWGKLGDSYGYKPMVIRACVGLFITQTLILFFSNVFLIFIFRLLQGVLAGFIVAAQAWALAISPDSERGATIGKLQSATAVGNLMGPLLGGVIATFAGYQSIFSLSSVICAAITILFYYFLQDATSGDKLSNEESSSTFSGLLHLQKSVLSILLVIIFIQTARAVITPIFALFVTEKLGGNDMTVGILYAATGLMIFISAPWWGKLFDKIIHLPHHVYNLIVVLLFICAILQGIQAYATTPTETFILRILWGVCLGALLPVLLRLLADTSERQQQGLFLGFGNSATKLGNLIGIILGAVVETQFGYTNTFIATALFYILSCVLILAIKPAPTLTKGYSLEQ